MANDKPLTAAQRAINFRRQAVSIDGKFKLLGQAAAACSESTRVAIAEKLAAAKELIDECGTLAAAIVQCSSVCEGIKCELETEHLTAHQSGLGDELKLWERKR